MKIAKPLLSVTTPVGMVWGLVEARHLTGGLAFLMAMMMGLLGFAMAGVVRVIRAERRAANQVALKAADTASMTGRR